VKERRPMLRGAEMLHRTRKALGQARE